MRTEAGQLHLTLLQFYTRNNLLSAKERINAPANRCKTRQSPCVKPPTPKLAGSVHFHAEILIFKVKGSS
jgi:hypothetical protein